jgi:hypothetical protein
MNKNTILGLGNTHILMIIAYCSRRIWYVMMLLMGFGSSRIDF